MSEDEAIELIRAELRRATRIHPEFPTDMIHGAGILCEEAGEAIQAALDYHYSGGKLSDFKTELTHAGAMAIRNLMNLDNFKKTL